MRKKALIIVDMLNDFVDRNGALYCGETVPTIIPFIRERIEAFRDKGDPVIYLRDSHDENDKEFARFPEHCVEGTWGSRIVPELAPLPGEPVIAKKRFSGFFRTNLEAVVAAAGVAEVEVVGVCTSICVMDTVGGFADRDYAVRVPVRGVADFNPEFHRFSLERMKQIYGADVR